jgi:hypothetical protein
VKGQVDPVIDELSIMLHEDIYRVSGGIAPPFFTSALNGELTVIHYLKLSYFTNILLKKFRIHRTIILSVVLYGCET